MITLQIPREEWETATKYWLDLLSSDKIKNGDNSKKIEFLSKNIFNNNRVIETNDEAKLDVPSVRAMTQLMNEIENDIDAAKTTFSISFGGFMDNDVDDTKNTTTAMLNHKENEGLKEFVTNPV